MVIVNDLLSEVIVKSLDEIAEILSDSDSLSDRERRLKVADVGDELTAGVSLTGIGDLVALFVGDHAVELTELVIEFGETLLLSGKEVGFESLPVGILSPSGDGVLVHTKSRGDVLKGLTVQEKGLSDLPFVDILFFVHNDSFCGAKVRRFCGMSKKDGQSGRGICGVGEKCVPLHPK